MNSKDLGADLALAWPEAEIGSWRRAQAVGIVAPARARRGRRPRAERDRLAADYADEHLGAAVAAREGFIDEVIEPARRAPLAWALGSLERGDPRRCGTSRCERALVTPLRRARRQLHRRPPGAEASAAGRTSSRAACAPRTRSSSTTTSAATGATSAEVAASSSPAALALRARPGHGGLRRQRRAARRCGPTSTRYATALERHVRQHARGACPRRRS